MKILLVIWSVRIGGAETFAVDLYRYLKARGHSPYLFPVMSPWDKNYYKSLTEKNVVILSPFTNNIIDWFFWKLNAILSRFTSCRIRDFLVRIFFTRAMRENEIEVILSNGVIADRFVYTNNKNQIPHFIVEHGEYSYSAFDNLKLNTEVLKRATQVISVSNWCQQILFTTFSVSSKVIYNGHTRYLPVRVELKMGEGEPFIFGMIGRDMPQKGWDEAISAFLLLKQKIRNVKLILIGGGDYLNILKEKYEQESDIEFKGRLTKPLDVLQNVNVGLVPSRKYEAFGIVLLDFFSLGIPVVASKVGALPEVIQYGGKQAGLLVDVDEKGHAQVDKLSHAMYQLIIDSDLYSHLSNDAKEIYKAFPMEKTGEQYETLIHQTIV